MHGCLKRTDKHNLSVHIFVSDAPFSPRIESSFGNGYITGREGPWYRPPETQRALLFYTLTCTDKQDGEAGVSVVEQAELASFLNWTWSAVGNVAIFIAEAYLEVWQERGWRRPGFCWLKTKPIWMRSKEYVLLICPERYGTGGHEVPLTLTSKEEALEWLRSLQTS